MSERRTCHLVKQPRDTQRYQPTQREDEDQLIQAIITLVSQYRRYGYRRITALLKLAGWQKPGRENLHLTDEDLSVGPGSGIAKG